MYKGKEKKVKEEKEKGDYSMNHSIKPQISEYLCM